MAHEQWETNAISRFIKWLDETGQGKWTVTGEEIVVDERNHNYDYELSSDGQQPLAVELFRLIESEEQIATERFWSNVSNQIAKELRNRGVKGYTIRAPRFTVSKNKIPEFVQMQADVLERGIAEHPGTEDEFRVGMFDLKFNQSFPDVSLYSIGGGGIVHPFRTATVQLEQLLPRKNQQLAVRDHRKLLLIVNWSYIVDPSEMLEACSILNFSAYGNVDGVYFDTQPGPITHVYEKSVYSALSRVPDDPEKVHISPLFVSTISNRLDHKDETAFEIVRKISEARKSAEWLDALARSQLVSYGEGFIEKGDLANAIWVIEMLEHDSDPEITATGDDAHHKIASGEEVLFIFSVRGRLCWLLYKLVCADFVEYFAHVMDILERFAAQENLYIRSQATIPLEALAVRRLAKRKDESRYMSDELSGRVKALAFRMLRENRQYPGILRGISSVFVSIRALSEAEAREMLDLLASVSESDSVDNIAFLLVYFGLFRGQHHPEIDKFDDTQFQARLQNALRNGSPRLRGRLANRFVLMLERKDISAELATDFLSHALDGDYDSTLNLHLYQATNALAGTHPQLAYGLIEKATYKEITAIEADPTEVIWHGREYRETLENIGKSGEGGVLEKLRQIRADFEEHFHDL